ncbi:MAG: ComEA family DNA-binding protein [Deltaproteobacteria bacterium]|nr:ComEA family DNA-binding protein [Deltaproteobacteria bacterium]
MKKLFAVLLVASFVIGVVHLAFAEDSQKININAATVNELIKLDRIGPALAQRIIQYREENGPFQVPEDIMKVKGIGEKTFEANKDRITIE